MIRPRRWGKGRRSVDRIDGGMSRFLLEIARQAFSIAEPMRPCCAVQGFEPMSPRPCTRKVSLQSEAPAGLRACRGPEMTLADIEPCTAGIAPACLTERTPDADAFFTFSDAHHIAARRSGLISIPGRRKRDKENTDGQDGWRMDVCRAETSQ